MGHLKNKTEGYGYSEVGSTKNGGLGGLVVVDVGFPILTRRQSVEGDCTVVLHTVVATAIYVSTLEYSVPRTLRKEAKCARVRDKLGGPLKF